jgi:hypothetical protein
MSSAAAVCLCGAVLDGIRLPNKCLSCNYEYEGRKRHAPSLVPSTGFDRPHIAVTPTGARVSNTWHG